MRQEKIALNEIVNAQCVNDKTEPTFQIYQIR